MRRGLVRAGAAALLLALVFVVLHFVGLLVLVASNGVSSMAPAIPACDGRVVSEGFTYLFREPRNGEIVAVHAAETSDGRVIPDRDARDLVLTSRVVAGPGDQVVGRGGSVFVNGIKIDDIRTAPFAQVELAGDRYFVLGDNRSASQDSREFGPVLRDAIFGRVFVVVWPPGDFGPTEGRHAGAPPGRVRCSS